MSYHECLEGPAGCAGPVDMYAALSGSGERYPRCEVHFDSYVARVQPKLDAIAERYPAQAPSWFDPAFAGERWSDDD